MHKNISRELSAIFTEQTNRCAGRAADATTKDQIARKFEWAASFTNTYLHSRLQRAFDLESPIVADARSLARTYVGAGISEFFATCVDGRNMPTVMFSKAPHVGGVLRAPAGTVTGFLPGQATNSVYIDRSTFVVQRTIQLLQEHPERTLMYGFDSHIGCAARGLMHETEGGSQKDSGIRADISNKLLTARGIRQLQTELQQQGKSVSPVVPHFFSYDPHTGGIWMGLETCINRTEVVRDGFTEEILRRLAAENAVVSTIELLSEELVRTELESVLTAKSAAFREAYADSLLTNWRAITALYENGNGVLFAFLLEKVLHLYRLAGWHIAASVDDMDRQQISEITLQHKTRLLLKNLVTRFSIAGTDEVWPFDDHQEEMVVITDGGHAPYPQIDAFAVFSRDLNALVPNTKLTIDLIRSSRRHKKISNPIADLLLSDDEFVAAPVLIINKATIPHLHETDWQDLEALDLDSLFSSLNWDDQTVLYMGKSEVSALLLKTLQHRSVQLDIAGTLNFISAIHELFERMQVMMRDKQFRQMLLSGNIILLNMLIDKNRKPRKLLQIVV